MADHPNLAIARRLLGGIAGSRDPDEVATLFAPNLVFEVRATTAYGPGSGAARDGAWWQGSCAACAR